MAFGYGRQSSSDIIMHIYEILIDKINSLEFYLENLPGIVNIIVK